MSRLYRTRLVLAKHYKDFFTHFSRTKRCYSYCEWDWELCQNILIFQYVIQEQHLSQPWTNVLCYLITSSLKKLQYICCRVLESFNVQFTSGIKPHTWEHHIPGFLFSLIGWYQQCLYNRSRPFPSDLLSHKCDHLWGIHQYCKPIASPLSMALCQNIQS